MLPNSDISETYSLGLNMGSAVYTDSQLFCIWHIRYATTRYLTCRLPFLTARLYSLCRTYEDHDISILASCIILYVGYTKPIGKFVIIGFTCPRYDVVVVELAHPLSLPNLPYHIFNCQTMSVIHWYPELSSFLFQKKGSLVLQSPYCLSCS